MAQAKVLKQVSRPKRREPATENESPRSALLEVLEASTCKMIASIDEALARA